ncbi:MAG: insecticidal toxin complex protein, partial [Candidatus Electrothrix sp. AR3]|nr:insecticidal toxin complex protein [Candidatus Electrothrix sp. AR3]
TQFYRDGCIENQEPQRYQEIKQLNDGLRERGRAALLVYLTQMDRVPLPGGGFAQTAQQLSELLLLDVEAGQAQEASRIEEAVTAVQLYVNRARLGLEENFSVNSTFIAAWEGRFSSFQVWQAWKRREIYRENWIEWDEADKARQSEAYQLLEAELRRSDLTLPHPALSSRPDLDLPDHPGLTLLQHHEPTTVTASDAQGLSLLATPERQARASWLAPGEQDLSFFPMWFQAAVGLGTKFLRIAAAGIPSARSLYRPKPPHNGKPCDTTHPAMLDEYYFWLEPGERHEPQEQVAEWGIDADNPSDWHCPDKLPGLLHWEAEPTVHLHWCRMHNGAFHTPRRSHAGVQLAEGGQPALDRLGV